MQAQREHKNCMQVVFKVGFEPGILELQGGCDIHRMNVTELDRNEDNAVVMMLYY